MIKQTLYFGNPAYLSTENFQLIYKNPQTQEKISLPIEDLGVVILDHYQIQITHALMDQFTQNNVAVITCNSKHLPSGLLLPLEGNVLQHHRFDAQITANEPTKKQIWQQLISSKINNQAKILQKYNLPYEKLTNLAKNVKSGDSENAEATAAAYYWKILFTEKIDKIEFLRDRFGEFPNNFLNYGYAILRAIVARALVAGGLLPTFGVHHKNQYNAYCLADDVMEPYRIYVDDLVLSWIFSEEETELTKQAKAHLLNISSQDVRINKELSPLMVAVQTTVTSLRKYFEGNTKKLLVPEFE